MHYPWAVTVSAVGFLAVHSVILLFFVRRVLSTFARRFAVGLLATVWTILVMNIIYAYPNLEAGSFIEWLFHLDFESNLPNTLSGTMLLFISVLSLLLATRKTLSALERVFWVFMGITFFVVGYDELLAPLSLHGTQTLMLVYGICGLAAGSSLLGLWWRSRGEARQRYMWMIVGLGLIGVGGYVLDQSILLPFSYRMITRLEETVELGGLILLLVVVVSIAQEGLSPRLWSGVKFTGGAALAVFFLLSLFTRTQLHNPLRMYLDQPQVSGTIFGDDSVSLVAYDIPARPLYPGQIIIGTLYLQDNRQLQQPYHLSMHFVSPSGASVTQREFIRVGTVNPGTRLRLPDWIVRNLLMTQTAADDDAPPSWLIRHPFVMKIPEDAPVPSAYALTMRLWTGDLPAGSSWKEWEALSVGLPIQQTTHELLTEDTLKLVNFAVLPAQAETDGEPAGLVFDRGIEMSTYQLPQQARSGEEIPVSFSWQADKAVEASLVQILHITGPEDTYIVLDRPPFGGMLSTDLWTRGFAAVDRFSLSLPDDLPPGTYQLYTGLYTATENLERLSVQDGTGRPYQDNLVPLETFEVSDS